MSQFWNIVKLFTTPSVTPVLFGGGMLGYVMYDVTHYYLHHAQPTKAVTKNLKVKQSFFSFVSIPKTLLRVYVSSFVMMCRNTI